MIEWLGASLLMLKHKDDVRGLAGGGMTKLFGKRTTIAITGMQGVGKSVLLDHLSGKPYKMVKKQVVYHYTPPHQSQATETKQIKKEKKRIVVTTVPGQDAQPRHVAIDKLFSGRQPVDGVIHVVGNGFARIRSETMQSAMIRDQKMHTIEAFRGIQLAKELDDLEDTCKAVRDGHKKRHLPRWLIVAVDQADLYQDTIGEVRDYYSPESRSPFADRLRSLKAQVGSDFFRWDETIPVCAYLDKFVWNNETRMPQVTADMRDAYLGQFLDVLKSYCM